MRQVTAPYLLICLTVQKKIIALWPNAVQQGRVAGYQMASESNTVDGTYSVNAIDFFGLVFAPAVLSMLKVSNIFDKIKSDGDVYKRLVFEGDRLVGFVLINQAKMQEFIQILFQIRLNFLLLKAILWKHRQYFCLIRIQEFKS